MCVELLNLTRMATVCKPVFECQHTFHFKWFHCVSAFSILILQFIPSMLLIFIKLIIYQYNAPDNELHISSILSHVCSHLFILFRWIRRLSIWFSLKIRHIILEHTVWWYSLLNLYFTSANKQARVPSRWWYILEVYTTGFHKKRRSILTKKTLNKLKN